MNFDVTLADIQAAATRIAGKIRRTPTYHSAGLSARLGVETVVKVEALQLGGSFKVRGCFNKLMGMSEAELARGVVTVSGGNHAIAVSMVASAMGARALVLMPKDVAPLNIALTKGAGGEVELCEDAIEAFGKAADYAAQGMTNIHSFDDPAIIAGHGSLGLELASDASGRLDHVFISIGGGGFSAGVGAALKGLDPAVRIHGVETEGATTMTQALAAGKPVPLRATSIARTLNAPSRPSGRWRPRGNSWRTSSSCPISRRCARSSGCCRTAASCSRPAAACVVAAAIASKDKFKPGERVGLVLCGSNVALEDIAAWRTQFGV